MPDHQARAPDAPEGRRLGTAALRHDNPIIAR